MTIQFRDIQLAIDKNEILDFHCFINYESESLLFRSLPYEVYREYWLASPQPEEVLHLMKQDLVDDRNIVQFALINQKVVGFLWVRFTDVNMTINDQYTIAEMYDVGVKAEYRKQGIGTEILAYIDKEARRRGAKLIRSGAGINNIASQKLHEKYAFHIYQVLYEKKV